MLCRIMCRLRNASSPLHVVYQGGGPRALLFASLEASLAGSSGQGTVPPWAHTACEAPCVSNRNLEPLGFITYAPVGASCTSPNLRSLICQMPMHTAPALCGVRVSIRLPTLGGRHPSVSPVTVLPAQ